MDAAERSDWESFRDSIFPYIEQMSNEDTAESICKQLRDVALVDAGAEMLSAADHSFSTIPALLGASFRISDRLPVAPSAPPPSAIAPSDGTHISVAPSSLLDSPAPLPLLTRRDYKDERLAAIRRRLLLKPSQASSHLAAGGALWP